MMDYRQALEIQQRLTADYPDDDRYRRDLGKTFHHLAILTRRSKSRTETEEAFRRVFELREDLARRYPEEPELRSELAQTLISYGLMFRPTDLGRTQEIYLQALAIQEGLVRERPEVEEYLGAVANTKSKLAELAYANHDFRAAEEGFLGACDLYARLE